jgi:hypothetical protein
MKNITRRTGFILLLGAVIAVPEVGSAAVMAGDIYNVSPWTEDVEGMEAWDSGDANTGDYLPPAQDYPAYEPGREDESGTFPLPDQGTVMLPWFIQRFQADI